MRSKVAVLKTSPTTVLKDYKQLLQSVDYDTYLPRDKQTALKINISWHYFYPACSTTPWQIEGVLKTLLDDGYAKDSIYACHNRTVVVSAKKGERANKHINVVNKYGIDNVHLYEGHEWIRYQPKSKLLVLDKVFPEGIYLPKCLIGNNIIQLPTMKTHVFTTTTGAMKNAFGGLLHEKRHYTHSVIHETLVDLLMIQKEIHSGLFAVMDGTFAGDGPGPRCMVPYVKNFILASDDQVAIDAVAAKMMGFNPMDLRYIRLAHERGLGCGDVRKIQIIGEDISKVNFAFHGSENTFASKGQKMIYWGSLKWLEHLLLRTFIVPWSYVASILYHDVFWYNFIGKKRVNKSLQTAWGELFKKY